jgi:hypothetical protein
MKNTYYLLLILSIISCDFPKPDIIKFHPESLEENEIKLSEIADDVIYIPLDNSYPIGIYYGYRFVGNSIYISVKDLGILEFDRHGNFIRKIGSSGRGPGEYHYCMYFDVDSNSKSVYILDRSTIKVYSKNGGFHRSFPLSEYEEFFDGINYFDEKLILSKQIHMGQAKYSWLILDTLGTIIKLKHNPIPAFQSNLSSGGGTYKYDNKISYWNCYNDTVYSIYPDLNYKAALLFSHGKHRQPKSINYPSSISEFKSYFSKYLTISTLLETEHYFIFEYFYRRPCITVIEKKSTKSFITYLEVDKVDGNAIGGILNNIDGGLPFLPEIYFTENNREYLVSLLTPIKLRFHIASNQFTNVNPKFPEKKEELEILANSLKETDNPVLMIVRLKK